MEKEFKDDTLLARWLSGELTDVEREALSSRADLKELRQVIDQMNELTFPKFEEEKMWKNLSPQLDTVEKRKSVEPVKIKSLRRNWWIGVAATLALLIGVGYFVLYNPATTLVAMNGSQVSFSLPNGSTLVLNAGSEATYYKKQWSEKRVVNLKGEGYFKVTKGQPFIVDFSDGQVEVLGTEFNIQSRNKKSTVQCFEGRVAVRTKSRQQEVILNAKEGVVIEQRKLGAKTKFTEIAPPWTSGRIRFEEEALVHVFGELERQYNITISYPNEIAVRKYSGTLPTKNLDNAMKFICESMNLTFEKKQNNLIEIRLK